MSYFIAIVFLGVTKMQNKLFEDMTKLAGSAMHNAAVMRKDMENWLSEQVQAVIARTPLVKREEFDNLYAMVQKLRQEQEDLKARLSAAEKP